LKYGDIRLKRSGIKFNRPTPGYSLSDHRRNENVLGEFKVDPDKRKLAQYKQKYLNHVSRLEDITQHNSLTINLSE
jgi:hypothetical protein